MSARKATRRPKAREADKTPRLPKEFTPTPIFDLTEKWLHDLGMRSAEVTAALLALRDYPYRSREAGAYGVEPLEQMGNKLVSIGQSALECAAEIRDEIAKPAKVQS
jgi:hypothetical protein